MIAALLLVAIFSSALPFQAEAKYPPKCKQATIAMIYDYWHKHNGIPQRVAEHNIKCNEREVVVMSTPDYFVEEITCVVIRHFASSHAAYSLKSDNTTAYHEAEFNVFAGQTMEPLSKIIRLDIAESNGCRLTHKCSRDINAEEGDDQYVIKGTEGEWTQEGLDDMQKLMSETFGVTGDLRTYTTPCTLPEGIEEAIDTCSNGSF